MTIAIEHTRSSQFRVSLALLGTLAGGMLLISSAVSNYIYGTNSFNTTILAMTAAVLLGAPIVWHAIQSIVRQEAHMDELVALAIVAAFVTAGEGTDEAASKSYVTAGIIAFFMLLSELIESRTALGAQSFN